MVFILTYGVAFWRPTVCGSGVWAGVDNVWEQKKLEARKMLLNRADSHTFTVPHQDGGPSFFPKGHEPCPENALLGDMMGLIAQTYGVCVASAAKTVKIKLLT
jgi:hypothetical protein